VRALDIVLGAQVFQVDPHRRAVRRSHAGHEGLGRVAAEGLDDDIARLGQRGVLGPVQQGDAGMALGRHPPQRGGVVHPQAQLLPAVGQIAGQAPAHPQVAVVVDHAAEDVPAPGCRRGCDSINMRP
jgi:hypothetical protein